MPTTEEHLNLADSNENFYDLLQSNNISKNNWSIIITFYVAVHYADSFLDRQTGLINKFRHPKTHRIRNNTFVRECNDANAGIKYTLLWNESKNARYEPNISLNYTDADVQRCEGWLNEIKVAIPTV